MRIEKLTTTELGFMQNTKYKNLARLPYGFVRQHNFDKVKEFDAIFFDCTIFDENENEYLIRCIERNSFLYTTKENFKILQQFNLI